MISQRLHRGHLNSARTFGRRRFVVPAAGAALVLWTTASFAQVLTPSNVYMSAYHAPRLNNAGVAETRANAFTIMTNGVIDRTAIDRIDTFNSDNLGNTLDFVGLHYATPSQFDFIQIELGNQFGDGGDWQSIPNVYVLKNPLLTDGTVEPNMSPNWVLLPSVSITETTGHVFSPTVVPGPGGTIRLNLTGISATDRTGWAWAVGGVDGNQNASNVFNFISLTEAWAEGQGNKPVPAVPTPATLRPVNIIANAYNSPGRNNDGLAHVVDHIRGQTFASVTNGVVDHAGAADGFDTFQGDAAGTLTDFVGLQYSSINRFDSITVDLANQFADGGDWDSTPRLFILKNPVDTNTSRPETDPTNWQEIIGAPETTGHAYSPLVAPGPGGTMTFNLSSLPANQRTGWGWAVGGVDGNANGAGVINFVSVTELSATGAVIPRPYDLTLKVQPGGEVRLSNDTAFAVDLDFYQITSAASALSESAWNSLGDGAANPGTHTPANFPVGNGTGNGWEEMGNLNNSIVAEGYLQGASTLGAGQYISLGNLYAGSAQDLKFTYRLGGGVFIDGTVQYSSSAITGDYNGNGIVDGADYVVWRNNNGLTGGATPSQGDGNGDGNVNSLDYTVWRNNFGDTSGSGSASQAAVPEPGTFICLLAMSPISFVVRHRK
jgi:hypothetical protein